MERQTQARQHRHVPEVRRLGGIPMTPIPMICESCDRTETDPIMIDVERCGVCGDPLAHLDVDRLRDDRMERQRLAKEDGWGE